MNGESEAQDKLLPLLFCLYNRNKCPNFNKNMEVLNTSTQYQWKRTSLKHNTSVLAVDSLPYIVQSYQDDCVINYGKLTRTIEDNNSILF